MRRPHSIAQPIVIGAAVAALHMFLLEALSIWKPVPIMTGVRQHVLTVQIDESRRSSAVIPSGVRGRLNATVRLLDIHVRAGFVRRIEGLGRELPRTIPEAPHKKLIDWERTLRTVARLSVKQSMAEAHKTLTFGFPKTSFFASPKPKRQWDGWHRRSRVVEFRIGRIVIKLTDYCDLVFAPFPMFGCVLSKDKLKGDLFKNMNKNSVDTDK